MHWHCECENQWEFNAKELKCNKHAHNYIVVSCISDY